MQHLEFEQLLDLHAIAIARYGGSEGVKDAGRLEAVIATQSQQVFGIELYPGVHEKAAAMMRGIVADHPFYDGNKRTGLLVALTFMEINGIQTNAIKGELEDFAVTVAVDHLSVEDIASWLKAHTSLV